MAAVPFSLSLSPSGRLVDTPAGLTTEETDERVASELRALLDGADAAGSGAVILHLALAHASTPLGPGLAYWRSLGRLFVSRVAAAPDVEERRGEVALEPPVVELAAWLDSAPPFPGAEYLSMERATALWVETHDELRRELTRWKGTVEAYLSRHQTGVHVVGRVCFHLAENRNDPERPFAFLATYATRLSDKGKVQHRPLGQAVRASAESRDRAALLTLLAPVQRASAASPVVRELVETGAIYQPLAWTAAEAHRFLADVPAFEASGLVLRVPDWWRGRRATAPTVRVRIGDAAPAGLATEGLLDFSVDVALDGEALSREELESLLAGSDGLVMLRGRWVEIDRARLQEVLEQWQSVERAAEAGITFHEALRLVAGASALGGSDAEAAADPERRFTQVEAGDWLTGTLARLRSPEGIAAADPGDELQATLRPYQQTGLRWLWWLRSLGLGGCLADDMGLGKTVQVIGLLALIRRERQPDGAGRTPSLLVVPASLIGNWQRELERFAPRLRVLVAHTSALPPEELRGLDEARLREHDLVITTYGSVARLPLLGTVSWDLLVLDEAQAIKNPSTRQARAVKGLGARTRLALTGTPVENRLGDLWSLFDFLAPGLLGSAPEFSRFAKALSGDAGNGYASLRALVRPYILRRLKTDKSIISDLPDKSEVNVYCPLTRKQAALYQQSVEGLARALAKRKEDEEGQGIERRGLVLATLLRLKQICNHPSQWLKDGAWNPDDSGKLRRLRAIVDELASRQDRALVFTQFREIADPLSRFLAEAFGRPGLVLTGDTPIPRRKKLVDEFQDPDGPPFFVISLKAGGTGLNLTAANHVIHFDRWWNPAVENQATDRAFRIGQKRNVLVHKLVCRGTVEERIDAMLAAKRTLSEQVLADGSEVNLTELDDKALLAALSLDLGKALAEA